MDLHITVTSLRHYTAIIKDSSPTTGHVVRLQPPSYTPTNLAP